MYAASASSHQSPSTMTTLSHIYSHAARPRPTRGVTGPVGGGTKIERGCGFGCELMRTVSCGATALYTNQTISPGQGPMPRSVADSLSGRTVNDCVGPQASTREYVACQTRAQRAGDSRGRTAAARHDPIERRDRHSRWSAGPPHRHPARHRPGRWPCPWLLARPSRGQPSPACSAPWRSPDPGRWSRAGRSARPECSVPHPMHQLTALAPAAAARWFPMCRRS